ncbi:MAG: hypothetical protein J6T92_06755, partial [Ottowia sp.]|nr:hypothetical protein [Ottowia sp.]
LLFALFYGAAEDYGFTNGVDAVCNTLDVTTCNQTTVHSPDYMRWLFADDKHFTPEALRLFGTDSYSESGYTRFKDRW